MHMRMFTLSHCTGQTRKPPHSATCIPVGCGMLRTAKINMFVRKSINFVVPSFNCDPFSPCMDPACCPTLTLSRTSCLRPQSSSAVPVGQNGICPMLLLSSAMSRNWTVVDPDPSRTGWCRVGLRIFLRLGPTGKTPGGVSHVLFNSFSI